MRRARTAILAALLCVLAPGCSGKSDPAPAGEGRIVEYTVRGRVTELTTDPVDGPTVYVHHEPIPSFESEGEVVGMVAMVMPFPIGEGVPHDGLSEGAIIELTFRVRYSVESQLAEDWELVNYVVLPPDTVLIFNGDSGATGE